MAQRTHNGNGIGQHDDPVDAAVIDAYERRAAGGAADGTLEASVQAEVEAYLRLHQRVAALELPAVAPSVRSVVLTAAIEAASAHRPASPLQRFSAWLLRPGVALAAVTAAAFAVAVAVRPDRRAEDAGLARDPEAVRVGEGLPALQPMASAPQSVAAATPPLAAASGADRIAPAAAPVAGAADPVARGPEPAPPASVPAPELAQADPARARPSHVIEAKPASLGPVRTAQIDVPGTVAAPAPAPTLGKATEAEDRSALAQQESALAPQQAALAQKRSADDAEYDNGNSKTVAKDVAPKALQAVAAAPPAPVAATGAALAADRADGAPWGKQPFPSTAARKPEDSKKDAFANLAPAADELAHDKPAQNQVQNQAQYQARSAARPPEPKGAPEPQAAHSLAASESAKPAPPAKVAYDNAANRANRAFADEERRNQTLAADAVADLKAKAAKTDGDERLKLLKELIAAARRAGDVKTEKWAYDALRLEAQNVARRKAADNRAAETKAAGAKSSGSTPPVQPARAVPKEQMPVDKAAGALD
ncbi:MAG: hypothetical protein EXR79_10040 [Myxococcales bacterium]|nr:hypothetical protein [Myxococcales bacterium]